MDYLTFAADRLEHQRATALNREIELRRSILDRGITITPNRPDVTPLHAVGVWFRSRRQAVRLGISY
jgi:hypothetical protein